MPAFLVMSECELGLGVHANRPGAIQERIAVDPHGLAACVMADHGLKPAAEFVLWLFALMRVEAVIGEAASKLGGNGRPKG